MKFLKLFFSQNKFALLITLIPFLGLLIFVERMTINTPFWDQWELVPILKHVNEGHWYFSDFWHAHNEHRLFFPRIVMVAAALASDWNVRLESLISVGIALVSFIVLLAAVYINSRKKQLNTALVLLLAFIWFSPLQSENWLWGWQIQWYLNVLGVVISILGLALTLRNGAKKLYLATIVGGVILAQLSLGNGMLLWPIMIAALIYTKQATRTIWATTGVAMVITGLYYLNYADPEGGPSKSYALHHPIAAVQYLFSYIGRPLSNNEILAPLLGVLVSVVALAICARLFMMHKKRFIDSLPIIALGLYGVGSACITTLSRLGLGVEQSMSSRYTTISSLILVSLILLCFYAWTEIKPLVRIVPNAGQSLLVLVAVLVGINYQWGIDRAVTQHQYLKDIQGCTHQAEPAPICLLSTYPDKNKVAPRLQYLKDVHWGGY